MARPIKEGLDYFPLDVDIDQNDKIAIIEALHGIGGFAIVIKLLMKIYKEGYFYEWSKREQLLFSKRVNVDINTVTEVVNDCINEGLFNRELYETHNILTSKGIQKRYLEAVKRRKEVGFRKDLFLLTEIEAIIGSNKITVFLIDENENRVNVNNNSINDNKSTQRKEKESKEKKSKEKQNNPVEAAADNGQATAWGFYYQNFGVASAFVIDDMNYYIDNMGEELVIEALKRALKENKVKWSYAEGILKAWSKRNVKSLADVEGLDSEFRSQQEQRQQKQQQRSGYNKQPIRKEMLPDWFETLQQEEQTKKQEQDPEELAARKAALEEKLKMFRR